MQQRCLHMSKQIKAGRRATPIVAATISTIQPFQPRKRARRIMQINSLANRWANKLPRVGDGDPDTQTQSQSQFQSPGLATCKIKINALIEIKFIITIARATLLWCSLIKVSAVCRFPLQLAFIFIFSVFFTRCRVAGQEI